MLLIVSDNTDVYFNLAAEEYFLHEYSCDLLMLWRSKSAVVSGKHQNLCAEQNYGFCRSRGIQPARRLTGGGTVYHDLGNINFTFIQNLTEGLEKAIDFRRFLDPVREMLLSTGVQTEYSSRNDLLLNGKKISGNAEHIFQKQKRVLHHGTLLFDADLKSLGKALKPDGIYTDKAVKSVRSEVTNIREVLPATGTEEFMEKLIRFWVDQKQAKIHSWREQDVERIEKLRSSKYATTEWILHYSPDYTLNKTIASETGDLLLELSVSNGKIQTLKLSGSEVAKINNAEIASYTGKLLNEALSLNFQQLLQSVNVVSDPFVLF